jgi:hypothetical protein
MNDAIHFFATHPGWLGIAFIALGASGYFWHDILTPRVCLVGFAIGCGLILAATALQSVLP